LGKGETTSDALADIRSGFSEAYYSLRTALQFSTPDGAPSSLLVSSARPAEGKSTTAYAVALNLARVGKRVLLVDGDLRNPSMHRVVGVENERGMSNLLSGSADLASVVQRTRQENLFFIPCGPLPPNPAELWGGDRLHQFLVETRNNFDHVVFDGPPVWASPTPACWLRRWAAPSLCWNPAAPAGARRGARFAVSRWAAPGCSARC
ncbi:CpsD/CapB family tyrosine-protein kinase, partial [Brevundimonas sp.]|uniref:CpsD/CapB family tyrosine-protein kinase n=1 Tax=Brevundimonas sp. TaxID=1871086 RepID=UPI0025BAD548